MRQLILCTFLLASAASGAAQTTACSAISLGSNGSLNGFVPSPNDAWHQNIANAPVDPNSAKIITTSGDLAGAYLHPDFGSIAGGSYGIPYTVVDSSVTPGVPVSNTVYPDDSDLTLYPIPADLPIEGAPGECPTDEADRHAIIVDKNKCVVYELYQAGHCGTATPVWSASSNVIWDLTLTEQRPYGLGSADAAGLSVFEGLIRYDEIVAGQINHAIRFTALHTKADSNNGYFTAPATHAAGNLWGTDNIMGMRLRLKASFDVSGFSTTNQIILNAMKQYGMILADNGSNMFFQGTPDARWNDSDLGALKAIPSSAFDVVQMNPIYDSGTAPTGPAPVVSSFTASSSTVAAGTSVTLTPVVSGASYSFIDNVGFVRDAVTVTPTATTTYTLTSRNAFGSTSASTTVTVSDAANQPNLQFVPIAAQTYGAAPMTVATTSASTGAITYSIASGPASLAGSTLTMTGAGTVTVQASQAATSSYAAATATTSFVVNPAAPTLAFTPIASMTYGAAAFTVSSTSNSTGGSTYTVLSGPATISGNLVTVTGAGTVVLQVAQAAAGNYAAATATTSFVVNPAPAALTFVAIANQTYGAVPFAVSITSNSTGAATYTVLSGPAGISGNLVTLTGAGTVTLQVAQAAAGNYAAATATTSFVVNPAAPTLAFVPIANQTFGTAAFAVAITSNSTGAATYTVLSGPATISGNLVTLTGAGTVTLQVTQAAAGNYAAATATTSFVVAAPAAPISPSPSAPTGASVNLSMGSAVLLKNASVVFTAQVQGNGTVTPTGTVQILDGSTVVGMFPLAGGVASGMVTPAGGAGQHPFRAVYLGDSNYAGGSSEAVVVTVLGFVGLPPVFGW